MTDLAKLVVRLEAQTAQFQAQLETANRKLDSFGASGQRILNDFGANVVKGFAAFIAADRILDSARNSLQSFIDTGSRLGNLSAATGISIEALSTLEKAANLGGSSVEALDAALLKLARSQREALIGSDAIGAAFTELGISAQELQSLSLEQLFKRIADAAAGFADDGEKTAVIAKIFGDNVANLIPFLNQGASGIEALQQRVRDLGGEFSSTSQASADELENSLKRLGIVGEAAGRQFAGALAPALTDIAEAFTGLNDRTSAVRQTFDALGTAAGIALRVVIQEVANVGEAFARTSNYILAGIEITKSIASGSFQDITKPWADAVKENEEREKEFKAFLDQLWGRDIPKTVGDGAAAAGEALTEATSSAAETAKKHLQALNQEAAKAATTATNTLTQLSQQLAEQIATFNGTDAAALQYRLTLGSLSDEVEKAGVAGQQLAASLVQQQQALDSLKRTEEIERGLAGVNAQLEALHGNLAEAARIQFDAQNKDFAEALTLDGNTEGLEKLNTLRELLAAQAEYQQLLQEAQAIQTELAIAEDRVRNSQEVGAQTELQSLQELDALREGAVVRLDEIHDRMLRIAEASGDPRLIDNTRQFGRQVEQVRNQTDLLQKKFKALFREELTDAFADFVTGVKSAEEAFKSFAAAIVQALVRIAAEIAISQLFQSFLGGGSSGGRPSLFGIALQGFQAAAGFSGSFGGGASLGSGNGIDAIDVSGIIAPRAFGGPVLANQPYLVGENGPELFIPEKTGQIIANATGAAAANQAPIVNMYENPSRGGQVNRRRRDDGREEIDVFVADIRGGSDRARVLEETYGLTRRGR